jgi:hypothetical protein
VANIVSDVASCRVAPPVEEIVEPSRNHGSFNRLVRPVALLLRNSFSSFYEAGLADSRSIFQSEINPAIRVDSFTTFSALVLVRFVHRYLNPLSFPMPTSGLSH